MATFFREYAYTRFLASQIQQRLIAQGLDARLRKDNTDGDPDIESNFYVLRHSSCPAVSHLIAGVFMSRNWNL